MITITGDIKRVTKVLVQFPKVSDSSGTLAYSKLFSGLGPGKKDTKDALEFPAR